MKYKQFRIFMNDNGLTAAFLEPFDSLDEKSKRFFEEMPEEHSGITIYFIISTLREIAKYEKTDLIQKYGIENLFYVIGAHQLEKIPDCPAKSSIKNYFEIFNKVDTSSDNDQSDKIQEAKKIYGYFHDFFIRSENFDQKTADRILSLSEENDEFHRLLDIVSTYKFNIPFFYNVYHTPQENLEYLSDFNENVKTTINFFHQICKNIKYAGPFLGYTDSLSKARDTKKTFKKWDRLLYVHDALTGNENPSNEQLLDIGVKVVDKFNLSENYENAKLENLIRTDFQEAQTMIGRAIALTFPY